MYVITGPNGAGKTTFASAYLPDFVKCREFLNADLIASGLSPFAPDTQIVRAGRLLLERIKELSDRRADFGFETTLSGRSYLKLLADLKANGYQVMLFFCGCRCPTSLSAAWQIESSKVGTMSPSKTSDDDTRRA